MLPCPNLQLRPFIPGPTQRHNNTLKIIFHLLGLDPDAHLPVGIVVTFNEFESEGFLAFTLFPFLRDERAVYQD